MKTRILYRLEPCTCGCGGEDPWHRTSYDRRIRNIENIDGRARVRGLGEVRFVSHGLAKLPFSSKPVRVVKLESNLWFVDYNSIDFNLGNRYSDS